MSRTQRRPRPSTQPRQKVVKRDARPTMLDLEQLRALAARLESVRVLSVYVDNSVADPATRHAWEVQLRQSLQDLRRWLADSPHAEREAFARGVDLLEAELVQLAPAPGWAAFITEEGVQWAGALPVQVRTMAAWSTGICLVPYLRALKELRRVVAVVVDQAQARLWTYQAGRLESLPPERAVVTFEQSTHMGRAPRRGFHPGVHGDVAADAEQRARAEGTRRMLQAVALRVVGLAGDDGVVIVGGIPHVSAQAAGEIAALIPDRVLGLDHLDVHATPAIVLEAAREGGATIRNAQDLRQVMDAIDEAAAGGASSCGIESTRDALTAQQVKLLLLSPQFTVDHLVEAEDAARSALAQGAGVEVVSDGVAPSLDAHGGIAARLRYR